MDPVHPDPFRPDESKEHWTDTNISRLRILIESKKSLPCIFSIGHVMGHSNGTRHLTYTFRILAAKAKIIYWMILIDNELHDAVCITTIVQLQFTYLSIYVHCDITNKLIKSKKIGVWDSSATH